MSDTEISVVCRSMSASVILCTRNRATRLSVALNALAAMQVRAGIEWEVLIVDNGSTDATRDTVRAFIEDNHPRFRYVYEPEPGKTYALNCGISKAQGEILAFTDDDAIVDTNWLTAIVEAFGHYLPDGVGGKVLPVWGGERPGWLSDRFLNVLALLDYGDEPFQLNWKINPHMLYGVNFAFRKSVFDQLGGFNTILGSRGEDQELFDRLATSNACVIYDPTIVVQHVIPCERLTRSYYHDWYRAGGRARAKLDISAGRHVFGIPFFMLRKGLATLGDLTASVFARDGESIFQHLLWLDFYAAYYLGRFRIILLRAGLVKEA